MPDIAQGCHELRITDSGSNWRIMYHVAPEAVVVLEVLNKKTKATPHAVIDNCRRRLRTFKTLMEGKKP